MTEVLNMSYKFKQSKENARWLKLYEESEIYSLKQAYNSCSSQKVEAFKKVRDNYINYNATDCLKILTYNIVGFTARLYV